MSVPMDRMPLLLLTRLGNRGYTFAFVVETIPDFIRWRMFHFRSQSFRIRKLRRMILNLKPQRNNEKSH